MSDVINVKSTVAQAEGFAVEVRDTTLLSSRYFPTSDGDNFAGKEVLFDFDSSDLEKGAFISKGYKSGNTVSWVANSVVPPRVGSEDTIDPTDQDRVIFERLCRAQGADLNRAEAYQNLLNLKAARLAKRTDRAIEVLAALVLKEGKIDFDQAINTTGEDTEPVVCKFYDPAKGAANHYIVAKAWGTEGAHPYDDVCDMVNEGMAKGRAYNDLVLGATAWKHLSKDPGFKDAAGAIIHSEGMVIDFGDVDGAQHVAKAVFNGVQLNVIVYAGAYVGEDKKSHTFIDPTACILISEGIGRGLRGGCTLLNPEANGYGIDNSFVGMTGTHMQSIYRDYNNQKLAIREESRPLPAPKHAVDECDWIYCDTGIAIADTPVRLGEIVNGVAFAEDPAIEWTGHCSCAAGVSLSGSKVTITKGAAAGKTLTLYALREGRPSTPVAISGNTIEIPVDCDRDEAGKAMLYASAVSA